MEKFSLQYDTIFQAIYKFYINKEYSKLDEREEKEEKEEANVSDRFDTFQIFKEFMLLKMKEICNVFIECGFDINNRSNPDLLVYAISNGNYEMATWLLQKGLDINRLDVNGDTHLTFALKNYDLKVAKFLIENNVDVNLPDSHKFSPLYYAVGILDEKLIRSLLEKGANPFFQNRYGKCSYEYLEDLLSRIYFFDDTDRHERLTLILEEMEFKNRK
jgi:ankyrin repeat protein